MSESKPKMRRIRIPVELYDAIEEMAMEAGVSIGELVEEIVERHKEDLVKEAAKE